MASDADDNSQAIFGFGILIAALAFGICLIKGAPALQVIGWTIVAGVAAIFVAANL